MRKNIFYAHKNNRLPLRHTSNTTFVWHQTRQKKQAPDFGGLLW